MFEKIRNYFHRDLWDCSLREKKGWSLFALKALRIATLSIRGFFLDKCTLRASSLTYYTLMSIVPILAMSFAIARGFGYQEHLKAQLLEKFQDQQAVLVEIFTFSDRMLEQTRGGLLAGLGIAVLFWSASQLLSSMENALNHIWGVKKPRPLRRLLADYFAVILIAPIFFILSSSLAVFTAQILEKGIQEVFHESILSSPLLFFIRLIPYVLFWFLFSFFYYFLPNTRVRFSSAFLGGVIAGTLYLLVQWGYLYFQIGVNRYGAIYGSFAALPLFLIWVQLNWFILLFGAEVSFAYQTHEQREYGAAAERMSYGFRMLMSLWITQIAVQRFLKKKSPLTVDLLMKSYQIPYSIASPVLEQLAEAGILAEMKEPEGFLPGRDVNELRISDVVEALQNLGSHDLPLPESKSFERLEAALRSFQQQIQNSPQNRSFKDLSA